MQVQNNGRLLMALAMVKVLAVRGQPAHQPAVAPAMQKKPAPVTALANGVPTEAVNVILAVLVIPKLARADTPVADISTPGIAVIVSVTM